MRPQAIARWSLFIAIAGLAGASAGYLDSSGGGSPPQSPAASLARYLDPYYGTLSSPIYRAGNENWDLAVVTPTKSFVGQFQVLVDQASGWTMAERLPDPVFSEDPPVAQWTMPRGHYVKAVPPIKYPIIYFQLLGLGSAVPAVALFYAGVAGWTALVIGRIDGRWELVPFTKYGTGELPDPVFRRDGIVQTTANDCNPYCAGGHLTIRKFRFSSKAGRFDQFYVGGAGRPGSPDG
jgi:hypothetical protein